ncbi:hypothetical protein T459_00454 [Capsicum annuum]|uniref:Protein LITTLE ZIPPER 1-like n=1 Tax=Capsicum annuum TaxID=4072 RepID=A0A1U8F0L5_CAPAN|nr:protein LITTLE ZIPPER 1 [Capsicum annuum]PHT92572.1 hypothetical protein T459_00454 [Capsicum annuum]
MCMSSTEWSNSSRPLYFSMQKKQRSKISRVQLHRLARRKRSEIKETKKDMEMRNLKLYMENMSILEENEKLRKKASLLHQENIALMSEFQKKFSKFDRVSTKETPHPPTLKLTK